MDTSKLPIPARYDYWLHCADTWSCILNSLNMSQLHTIYDLCPGWSPKLELALTHTNFNGTICCIDQSDKFLRQHQQFLASLNMQYSVEYCVADLLSESQGRQLPDMIIGNHILDDLLLHAYCKKNSIEELQLFSNPESLHGVWNDIYADHFGINQVVKQLATYLSTHSHANTLILLTQYPGYQERLWNYPSSSRLLQLLQKELTSTHLFENLHSHLESIFPHIPHPYFIEKDCMMIKFK